MMTDMSATTSPTSAPAGLSPVIRVERAAVVLGGRTIWQEVELSVQPGEFLAILGPNGPGKSTLLRAILGLIPLSGGTISVLGQPARRGNAAIGYVQQRRHFEADVCVRGRSMVRLGLDGRNWGLPLPFLQRGKARDAARRVQEAIDLVGAGAYANRPIGELSGGEQQRLLIAQALVRRPRILALDEPLDSLDLRNQQGVAAVIRQVSRETGAAVLLVAPDIKSILSAGGRAACISPRAGAVLAPRPGEHPQNHSPPPNRPPSKN